MTTMTMTMTMMRLLLLLVVVVVVLIGSSSQCGPGRGSPSGRRSKKMTPLVFKQHVPNVSENTLGASGLAEGKITRNDPRFKDLVINYNSDIVFKDDEGTGADRIMTQRCKDKLNSLAVVVLNRWPGVRLRVTEGWDTAEGHHPIDSLHYEGRAVDITTSDRDRAKYGMLARLAVEAGFDWVYFESRGHVHCSVKSDSSIAVKTGGCFPGYSTVMLEDGRISSMENLSTGDRVLSVDQNGRLRYSDVIGFLHHDPMKRMTFQTIWTEDDHRMTITSDHLIYFSTIADQNLIVSGPVFASHVHPGHYLYRYNNHSSGSAATTIKVIRSSSEVIRGVYAPLTVDGTIVVDGIVASCYASLNSQTVAHAVMAPFRLANYLSDVIGSHDQLITPSDGIHWYARLLLRYAEFILPDDFWYNSRDSKLQIDI